MHLELLNFGSQSLKCLIKFHIFVFLDLTLLSKNANAISSGK
jgi:hypothetical protein